MAHWRALVRNHWVVLVALGALCTAANGGRHSFRQLCITENQQRGRCVPVKQCDHILSTLRKENHTHEEIMFLYGTECGRTPDGKALVCCVTHMIEPIDDNGLKEEPTDVRVSEQENGTEIPSPIEDDALMRCGKQWNGTMRNANRTLGSHPWTVLLHYGLPDHTNQFNCSGTLIASQYVLTSASCVDDRDAWNNLTVRVGEWDLESTVDCILSQDDDDLICTDGAYDVTVSEVILHEAYGGRRNDIALLKLSRAIEFSDWVKPICLPESRDLDDAMAYEAPSWKQDACAGSYSRFKDISTSTLLNRTRCEQYVPSVGGTAYNFLCASSTDRTFGDAGGALTVARTIGNEPERRTVYELVGVLSSLSNCANFDGVYVYTRVGQYRDWIMSKLSPAS